MHPDAHLLASYSRTPEEILSHSPHAEGILAAAVIAQAFHDAGWVTNCAASGIDRSQARAFLTSTQGEWAFAREAWAVAAGLCPEFVRDLALKLSKNPLRRSKTGNSTTANTGRVPKHVTVERVRERVDYLKSRGVDIATQSPVEVARALTAGGFTTPRGFAYDGNNVIELRRQYLNCRQLGLIEP